MNNVTTKYTWLLNIFAVDNGNPKRGDYVQLNITFSSTCLDKAKVTADTSGNVYFSAPGYTISTYGKTYKFSTRCFRCLIF